MSRIVKFFKSKWLIQGLGILALCLLLWFVGPLISVAGHAFLETVIARMIAIFIVVIIWFVILLRQQIKQNRANAQMVDEIADFAEKETEQLEASADQEIEVIKNNFDAALQTLKKTSSKNRTGKHYLYDLPWYIIIGPPGSGKTTALINSGLEFPLADRFGKKAVQGVGGTRNCDWWFTDQAVMIDTAGRYTTQDSHEAVDKAAWLGFLDLLKKYRPRRPLNGIVITMSLTDLLRLSDEEISLHAKAIRNRIEELYERMGVRIPIYMLFTKADLIAGFTDFFADLGKQERSQVWGVTFAEQTLEKNDTISQFGKELDELLERLNQRVNLRMQEERDLSRRQLIFGFPQRLTLLKTTLLQFLDECFSGNRYQSAPLIRGVYFTSGTQEGTPIDRLMGVLARTFKLDRIKTPLFSGKGKSYFITHLLKEVILAESALVGLDQKVETKRRLLQQFFYLTAVLLIAVGSALFANSYFQNKSLLRQFDEKSKSYQVLAAETLKDGVDFPGLLQTMNALRDVREVYPAEEIPWSIRFGLYQGKKLRSLAVSNYKKQLKNLFLPMIKTRLEQRMVGEESENVEILYQLLRVYLMLGQKDKADINVIKPWISVDWQNQYTVAVQQQLNEHLDELLKLDLPVQVLDSALIKEVRAILTEIPVAQQVYMQIKNEALQNHERDLLLAKELGSLAGRVFVAKKGRWEQLSIPGLFTYYGFHQVFLNESKDLAKQAVEQRWVLGKENDSSAEEINQIESKLFYYYYADFIKYWNDLLANIQVRRPSNIHQSIEILEIVSGYDSPLRGLLEVVARETSLTRAAAVNKDNALDKLKQEVATVSVGSRMKKLLNAAQRAQGEAQLVDKTGKSVESHFSRINEQLEKSSAGGAPLDHIIADLSALYATMADLGSTSDSGAAAVDMVKQNSGGAEIIAKMQRQSVRLPEPLQSLVKQLASGNQGLIMGGIRSQLNRLIKTEVGQLCKSSIAARYPFSKHSPVSVTLADFGHFFSKGGVMDQFFQTHLQSFVDTTHRRWRVISQNNQTVGISASTLRQFQNAAKIRDVFFQHGGALPKVSFSLKPVFLDKNASKFWLNLEGQQTLYRHGPIRSQPFTWPGVNPGLVRFGFETLSGKQLSDSEQGAWAWFKLLDKMNMQKLSAYTHMLTFKLNGLSAKYELQANSVLNPFSFNELTGFRCPNRI